MIDKDWSSLRMAGQCLRVLARHVCLGLAALGILFLAGFLHDMVVIYRNLESGFYEEADRRAIQRARPVAPRYIDPESVA